ncbi:Fur family transcriptional regulator [Pseudodesulfovibrio indicus]|jgi:Fur family ferric uptake transcriptional regulator|uniref:Fur family transcriptional regulator n=1 Tax=Pseudodesulfovibrio indicus TaxID=1716143 RepID=UPI00292FD27E|nr:Fur family transcriptional regulator [Pseudodesulfovibrio indicus]
MGTPEPADIARDFLERTGLEPTLNRILVWSAVASAKGPVTAAEVHAEATREHRLNRVTVYRILDLLAERGAVNRINAGERALRYCVGDGHSHFHCTNCGEVRCIANETLHFDESAVVNALGFTISHIDLQLEGLCPKCSRAQG